MRYLIDGYNLMHAGGLLGKRLGPEGFRKVRNRFLNTLSETLGPLDAFQTTVVFDASTAPNDAPQETRHKGITVVFAIHDENADERIEHLIARHATPRALTVVSSDRRIRLAASRRKAQSVTADDFWVALDARKQHKLGKPPASSSTPEPARDRELSAEESAFWLGEFGDLEQHAETREALNNAPPLLTDAEIAEIEREIERETER